MWEHTMRWKLELSGAAYACRWLGKYPSGWQKKKKKSTNKTKILILDFMCHQVNFFSYRTNCFYRNECFSSNPIPIRVAIGTDWELGKGKWLLSVFFPENTQRAKAFWLLNPSVLRRGSGNTWEYNSNFVAFSFSWQRFPQVNEM